LLARFFYANTLNSTNNNAETSDSFLIKVFDVRLENYP
jgi:hypothetical protein